MTTKNKLQRHGIFSARVTIRYETKDYQHPMIQFLDSHGYVVREIEFQRHSVEDSTIGTPKRHYEIVREAKECESIAGGWLDVGPVPFGLCYAQKWGSIAYGDASAVAKLEATLNSVASTALDPLVAMVEKIEKLGCAVDVRYIGRCSGEDRGGLAESHRNQLSRWLKSAAVHSAFSAYYAELAKEAA